MIGFLSCFIDLENKTTCDTKLLSEFPQSTIKNGESRLLGLPAANLLAYIFIVLESCYGADFVRLQDGWGELACS